MKQLERSGKNKVINNFWKVCLLLSLKVLSDTKSFFIICNLFWVKFVKRKILISHATENDGGEILLKKGIPLEFKESKHNGSQSTESVFLFLE